MHSSLITSKTNKNIEKSYKLVLGKTRIFIPLGSVEAMNSASDHITKASVKAKTISGMFGPQISQMSLGFEVLWFIPYVGSI